MKSVVECLAQIRLNTASVEQFLLVACSLADDNPATIKGQVYEAAKEARSAALLIDHLRNLFHHQQSIDLQRQLGARHKLHEQQQPDTQFLFTYSNQLTLYKAAKCLVANVAKILFLADSVVLFSSPTSNNNNISSSISSGQSASAAEEQEQRQQQYLELNKRQHAPDRLDNVANYSQLLRCFGELSLDLVDLGLCIMFGQQQMPVTQAVDRQEDFFVVESDFGLQQQQHTNELASRRQQDKKIDHLGQQRKVYLENQIQDMQTLFQVNRLIIERSILLLLSTSKCCLRLGAECLRRLEARRNSVLVQIRASISVIMAIVKCSVFSPPSLHAAVTSGRLTMRRSLSPQSPLLPSPPSPRDPAYSQWLRAADLSQELLWQSSSVAVVAAADNFNNNNNVLASSSRAALAAPSSQTLDELERDYYLRYLAAAACCQSPPQPESVAHLNSRRPTARQTTMTTAATLQPANPRPQNSNNNKLAEPMSDARATSCAAGSRAHQPLQIMNYFLQTWNGTQSAHDAINNLQLLVRPISRVTGLECLVSVLNEIFAAHFERRHNHHRRPAADPSVASAFGPSFAHQERMGTTGCAMKLHDEDKENRPGGATAANSREQPTDPTRYEFMRMEKRLLIGTLNSLFLDEVKVNLIERAHEFTDCAYTKHEQREDILGLLQCIRFQLNKLVKILYKCRKKASLGMNDICLDQLCQLASHIDESCDELKYELQTVVIEQSDELDRNNCQLELMKQMKHNCLVGDLNRCQQTNAQFHEQSEQLIEVCKMLNQIAPTNKMKITTKTLAIWFEMNIKPLLEAVSCLCENPSSKELKNCTWSHLQAWCSFYDDFCQLARQVAYLTHAQFDADRSARVAGWRDQVMMRMHQRQHQQHSSCPPPERAAGPDYDPDIDLRATAAAAAAKLGAGSPMAELDSGDSPSGSLELMHFMPDVSREEHLAQLMPARHLNLLHRTANDRQQPYGIEANQELRTQSARELKLSHANSVERPLDVMQNRHRQQQQPHHYPVQRNRTTTDGGDNSSFAIEAAFGATTAASTMSGSNDSPRSLDHYYGFGANYHRRAHVLPAEQPLQQQQQGFDRPQTHLGASSESHHHLQQQQAHYAFPIERRACMSPLQLDDYCAGGLQTQPVLSQPTALYHPSGQPYSSANPTSAAIVVGTTNYAEPTGDESVIRPPVVAPRRTVTIEEPAPASRSTDRHQQQRHGRRRAAGRRGPQSEAAAGKQMEARLADLAETTAAAELSEREQRQPLAEDAAGQHSNASATLDADKWSDSDADAIVRGAKETAQMALSMYQFTKGEGELNTTQDLFTQAELFAEEANELYKEVRCFSYKVPAGDLKKELLNELGTIPALVQQLQFVVKNPTVGKPATFAKVDSVIRETKLLMEAVNRVVTATLSCRQHYNMAIASMRKRTRMLSPSYRNDNGFEFENHSSARQAAIGGRHGSGGGGMGSEPDI